MIVTCDEILARVRRYADMRNADQGLLDSDLVDMINDALADYYDKLVAIRGHSYFEKVSQFTMTPGLSEYELPDDFYQMSTVTLTWSSTELEDVRPLVSNRDISDFTTQQWERFTRKGYRVYGSQAGVKVIRFYPTPTADITYTLRYIPAFEPLAAGSGVGAEIDCENSWHKLVCLDVAAEFRGLLGLPADFLIQRRDEQERRVMEMATERLQDDAAEIVDTERDNPRWYPHPRWNSGA